MRTLLSGYDKTTQKLIFRVYAEALPEVERKQTYRLEHFAVHDLLGAALAEDFGVHHAAVRRIGLGKPELIHDFLHMNLSHCKGLAVAAVGTLPLGVDAEAPRSFRENLLNRLCTAEEAAQILAAEDKNLAFTRLWTLKEAYAKYTGEGLRLDFSTLGFTLRNYDDIVFHHPAAARVSFTQIPLEPHYTISLCCPRMNNIALRKK